MNNGDWKDKKLKLAAIGILALGALGLRKMRGASAYAAKAAKHKDHSKTTVVITGGASGLGYRAAEQFACHRMRIILACKDVQVGEMAANKLRKDIGNYNITAMECDMSSFDSIRKFASDIRKSESRIDVLVNNAGVLLPKELESADGIEMQMAVNYFGPFLLTNLLLPKMVDPLDCARVVNVSSVQANYGELDFDDLKGEKLLGNQQAYFNSKLALNLFSIELARLGAEHGVHSYCVQPCLSNTDLGRHVKLPLWEKILFALTARSEDLGSQAIIDAVVNEKLDKESGCYYTNCTRRPWPANTLRHLKDAEKLWEMSEEITELEDADVDTSTNFAGSV